jgi:hypothetical protein
LHVALTNSPRGEYLVGGSTVKAIVGQKLIPGCLTFISARLVTKRSNGRSRSPRIVQTIERNGNDLRLICAPGEAGSPLGPRIRRRRIWTADLRAATSTHLCDNGIRPSSSGYILQPTATTWRLAFLRWKAKLPGVELELQQPRSA